MLIKDNKKIKLLVPDLDCEEITNRITALTRLVKAANNQMINADDLYYIMVIIEDHLPSVDLLREL